MLPVFLPFFLFYLALARAGPNSWYEVLKKDSKAPTKLVDVLAKEVGLLEEIMKGCSYTDLVNLKRVSKAFNYFANDPRVFQLGDSDNAGLDNAVRAKDLNKTKEILGLAPKRLVRPASHEDTEEFFGDLDLVAYAFVNNDAKMFELLVSKLGILDTRSFIDQFECLPTVEDDLAKFQVLEKHSVIIPFNAQSISRMLAISSPKLFEYLLDKGYIKKVLGTCDGSQVSSMGRSLSPKRYTRVLRQVGMV